MLCLRPRTNLIRPVYIVNKILKNYPPLLNLSPQFHGTWCIEWTEGLIVVKENYFLPTGNILTMFHIRPLKVLTKQMSVFLRLWRAKTQTFQKWQQTVFGDSAPALFFQVEWRSMYREVWRKEKIILYRRIRSLRFQFQIVWFRHLY